MIGAVVVCFNPNKERLTKVIEAIEHSVDHIWLIDNSEHPGLQTHFGRNGITHLAQESNIGIAAAQNLGISQAIENGAERILLLDHDSVMDDGAIEKMTMILNSDKKIAAAGCNYRMGEEHVESVFVREGWLRFARVSKKILNANELVEVDFMIASGSLITREAIQNIGLMNERFFIDHVDTDWCLRARDEGYKLVGATRAYMSHSLGERVRKFYFFGRTRFIPYHRSFRYYYIFRNSMWLYRKKYTSLKFISADIVRLISILIVCILFTNKRVEGLKMVMNGLLDGLQNRDDRAPIKPISIKA